MTKTEALFSNNTPVLTEENYRFLQRYIYERSGIVLDESKHYLLDSRLLPLVRERTLTDLNGLSAALRREPRSELGSLVVEAMTTNETLFFRDKTPFDALRKHLLPELLKSSGSRRLRVWSAASSTGQEAYSIAMLLTEAGLDRYRVEILGTDLSEQVLAKARAGCYSQLEVNRGLPAPSLVKHFARQGICWQLHEDLRQMVRFEQLDLRTGIRSLGTFDLIFCRNVLIYFDMETKRQILGQILNAMHGSSYLILGAAETTLNVDDRFQRKVVDGAVLYQKLETLSS
jgi:chemotaxis protein methyltransferase CheR